MLSLSLSGLREYINVNKSNFNDIIKTTQTFTPEAEEILKDSIAEFQKIFSN